MCGIAGIVLRENAEQLPVKIRLLTDSIAHRGPDGEGIHVRDNVAIGHRRLSIIDLEGGAQPMLDASGRYCLTFNGEIYNYKTLRQQLEGKGFVFKTASDTEVVLKAYMYWGRECVKRFRGMFAFGIADFERRQIFLARDPLGIKPLVYLKQPSFTAFASEIRGLRLLAGNALDIDPQAVDEYLLCDFIAAPRTVYRGMRKLEPGHYCEISFDGSVSDSTAYWQFEFRPDYTVSREEWLEALETTLQESVRAHLVSDVPFGAFLSGGIDSTAVVSYMANELSDPVRTFSIGFDDSSYDESQYSNYVADRWQTEHQLFVMKSDAMSVLPQLVERYGEPIAGPSAIPTYYMCQAAASKVKMVLSGDGADEAFGGYWRYFQWLEWIHLQDHRQLARQHGVEGEFLKNSANEQRLPSFDKWICHHTTFGAPERAQLWGSKWPAVDCSHNLRMREFFNLAEAYTAGHRVQFADVNTYLQKILTKMDMMSMIHGLEVRTPIVDIRVYELAARIPEEYNFHRDRDGRFTGKTLLKELLLKYFPQDFVYRKKQGFKVPLESWLFKDVANKNVVEERLLSNASALSGHFDQQALRAMLPTLRDKQVWSLLFLEEWVRGQGVTPAVQFDQSRLSAPRDA